MNMALAPKLFATVVAILCSVAVAGNSMPAEATGSSANFGKWWIETAQAKRSQRARNQKQDTVANQSGAEAHLARMTPSRPAARCHHFGYEFAEHLTTHFQLMYRPQGISADIAGKTGELLEEAHRVFFEQFGEAGFALNAIDTQLPWFVFNDPSQYYDFARAADGMDAASLESYYAARSNRVVLMQAGGARSWNYHGQSGTNDAFESRAMSLAGMDPDHSWKGGAGDGLLDVRRTVHEAAHQLAFNSGLQTRGVMYPLWVSEGLATNFESDTLAGIGVAGENPPRQRQLLRAYASGRLMPLEDFITLVNIRPGGPYSANDLYAQSWAFFRFLFKTRQAALREYLTTLAQLEPGPRSTYTMQQEFTDAFGSLERLEQAWNRYLMSLHRD